MTVEVDDLDCVLVPVRHAVELTLRLTVPLRVRVTVALDVWDAVPQDETEGDAVTLGEGVPEGLPEPLEDVDRKPDALTDGLPVSL